MLELVPCQRRLLPGLARLALVTVLVAISVDAGTVRAATPPQARARYAHADSGFAVEAPAGWRLVRDGEMVLPAGAKAAFINASSTVIVYVLVEFIPGGVIPRNDDAIAAYLARSRATNPATEVRAEPVPAVLSGRRALRRSSITRGQNTFVDSQTVTREGYYYFVIVSTAAARDERRQQAAHLAFERGVTISKSSDNVVDVFASALGEFVPYLNAEDLRPVMYSMLDRSTSSDGVESATLGYTVMVGGHERLPTADRETLVALQGRAIATLPAADAEFLVRIGREIAATRPVSFEDGQRSIQLARRAFASLSAAELAVLRRTTLESIRLGLEAYDNRPRPRPPVSGVIGGVPGGVPGGIPGGEAVGAPPPPPPTGASTPGRPRIQRVSGGVLAGKAIRKVQPPYPEMAHAAGIEGAVVVEVTVSEEGIVVSARAVSGHPLLRDAAVEAARGWAFRPTTIQGYPVKIVGTITFNFRKGAPPAP